MAKIKVKLSDLEKEYDSEQEYFDEVEKEEAVKAPKASKAPKAPVKASNGSGPKEINVDDLDYSEDEWDEEKEAAVEEALNEEFDRTYEGKGEKGSIFSRWWFWLICALVLLGIVLGYLISTGRISQFGDEEPSSVASVTQVAEYETIEVRDLAAPADAKVVKGSDGKWALYRDSEVLRNYNGVASNELGTWYINNGYVDFNYTGYLSVNGTVYKVNGGKVDTSKPIQNAKTKAQTASVVTSAGQEPYDDGLDSSGTQEQQDALAVAVDYINQMAFSREWLIAQVLAEGYNETDAAWAVDHCGADWNDQAYKKAQEYLTLTSFNKEDMITQLEFEGFTHEQAVYGAEKSGL